VGGLPAEHDRIKKWLKKDELKLTKVCDLLARRAVEVPYRTLGLIQGVPSHLQRR
jgi:hypothetical protein